MAFLNAARLSISFRNARPEIQPRRKQTPSIFCCAATKPRSSIVLSHFEACELLKLQKQARDCCEVIQGSFSIDLGCKDLHSIRVCADGISFNETRVNEESVSATWRELKKMGKKGKHGAYEIFLQDNIAPRKIAGISTTTNMPVSLFPVAPRKAPTMILGGFGMHRLKDTDPGADTDAKIDAAGLKYVHGRVLDVCTGLGYTAIQAGRLENISQVVTIELDELVVEIQRRNPWSADLFENGKIKRHIGNAVEVVKELEEGSFDAIVHDPPAQAIGGELYSSEFYSELGRVCRHGGKLFHYIGDIKSKESGRLYAGIEARLKEVGFGQVRKHFKAYGLTAVFEGK